MKKMKWTGLFILMLLAIITNAQRRQVQTGNKLYEQKKYKEASAAYQQALQKTPGYTPGMFNLGNALFQQKNYEGSRQVLTATAKQAADKNLKADANYNIGNTYMQEQKWGDAINAYKQALKNNPQDETAKYNLSYALAMMKKNQGGGEKNKNDKNDQNKDKQDQNKDQQNKQDQNKDKQDQNKEQQNQDQKKQDEKDEQRPQPQPSKLSKEQADQLLNALAQEEKKLHDKKEKGKAIQIKVDKDW